MSLHRVIELKRKRLRKKKLFILFLMILSVLISLYPIVKNRINTFDKEGIDDSSSGSENALHIVFLSVGQGDSAIVRMGSWSALIDTGLYDSYSFVTEGLKEYGIDKLDAVFITHPHYDHSGCLQSILRDYPVGHVYFADIPEELMPTGEWYERVLDVIGEKRIPLSILYQEDTVPLGDSGAVFETLWSGDGENLNNCSMVLKLTYGNVKALFMADAEWQVEKELISSGCDLEAQILKVGHHGSLSGSSYQFVKNVHPEYAVISCGIDNEFGYPKDKVLERLQSEGALILRTDIQGNIHFVILDDSIRYETEKTE